MLTRRPTAYPDSFANSDEEPSFLDAPDAKITRPLSAPGSPRERSGMMTPGDFASLQEGREGLSTEDYIAWKLPEEEEEADYPFPLTLKAKKAGPDFPINSAMNSGTSTPQFAPSQGSASHGGQPTNAVNGDKLAEGMGALQF